jgi:hypothetical protein
MAASAGLLACKTLQQCALNGNVKCSERAMFVCLHAGVPPAAIGLQCSAITVQVRVQTAMQCELLSLQA